MASLKSESALASSSSEELPLLQDLRGKTALLACRGATVLGTCSSAASLDQIQSLAQAIKQAYKTADIEAPRIIGLAANVLSPDFPDLVANKVRDQLGSKLNIIVNNAVYFEDPPIGELDTKYVQRMLVGNVQCLVLLMDRLLRDGYIQPESRIVNISSDTSRISLPFDGIMLYASAKAAMESLTRSWVDILVREPLTLGTTVNSLSVLSDGKSVHNGPGLPEDVANVAGLLVGEAARWINGSVVAANGGAVKIL
ncbi:3-oxoacyl-(acyl-carrier-protein) reductase [Colletotrichum tofieldiae]|uniref:3-oxoacyl-(Acyl-carrier-protein) reductase n=1 Tax=Colletotrichum tofieldiae TaxID=708197 RepID=A0A166USL7_9PEZI|nr:3-oxoacyl-(acyl-carrier-protein) reductase [Colletotrichum tofieldiae]